MNLQDLWFIVIAFFWAGFFVLEGFDFGVGALHRFVSRNETERRVAINSVGPMWDGNEVWLIIGGAAVFAAFPSWYATWFSAGYLALFLIIVALMVRGVSFEWRGKVDHSRWTETWSWGLTIASLLLPLLLGVALGDLLVGLPVDSSFEFTGSFWDLLTPYGLVTGVMFAVVCVLHGGTFLSIRTDGPVRHRAMGVARTLAWPAAVVVLLQGIWTGSLGGGGIWRWLTVALAFLATVVAAMAARAGREGWAFASTAVTLASATTAIFANLYPNVLVSSTNAANNLTVANSASNDYALKVMTIVALVSAPIALGYQAWSYYIFRARLRSPGEEEQATERVQS